MLNRYQIQYTDSGATAVNANMTRIGATAQGTSASLAGLGKAALGMVAAFATIQTLKKVTSVIEEFDTTMLEVKAVTRASAQEFGLLSEAARKMGAETRFSASESGQALLELAKIGFDTNQAIAALPATLNLAIAGVIGIERSATIAAITLKQFGLEVDQTTRVTDVLVRAANDSVTSVDGIASAMANVGPIAKTAGFDLETTTAAIETLMGSGLEAANAGTALKNILLGLSAPSDMAKQAISSLGLSLEQLDLNKYTLAEVFSTLSDAGMGIKEAEAMFGRLGVVGATTLAQYNEQIDIFTQRNKEAAGTAKETADIMDSGLHASFLKLKSVTEELMLKMGDAGIKQVLTGLVDVSAVLVTGLGDLVTNLGKVGTILGNLYSYFNTVFWGLVEIAGSTGFALVQTFTEAFSMIYDSVYEYFGQIGEAIFELIHGGGKTKKTIPEIFAENWATSLESIKNGWVVATADITKNIDIIQKDWDKTDFKTVITGFKNETEETVVKVKELKKVLTDLGSLKTKDLTSGFMAVPEVSSTAKVSLEMTTPLRQFAEENSEIIDNFSRDVSSSLTDMFSGVKTSFADLIDSLTRDIIRFFTNQMVNKMFTGLLSTGFSGFEVPDIAVPEMIPVYPEALALGGSYEANKPRMTSEYGAEVDIPSHSGRILSRGDAMQALSGQGSQGNVKVVVVDTRERYLEELKSIEGERIVVQHLNKNSNLLRG